MGRRTAAQRIGYAKADEAVARQATTIAFAGDRRDAITAEKRADERRAWNQRSHAATRADQRYGVMIDAMHLVDLGRRIATGVVMQPGLMLVGHASDDRRGRRTSVWLAWIADQEVPVVFDHDTQSIVTVLPAEANQLEFDRRGRYFRHLANGGTKAARTYWAEVRS
jgi:hypothetical protein